MSEVREEYTRENYPTFGKKYAGEKAIISLTSWRARINTCSKTIYSLLKQCPGFHIVLVLSEEEFPKMMDELPENLKVFAENKLIEILWVYKNYKSFKKVLFTMDKYRDVPIISADDDCIYTCNYAQELYNAWVKNKIKCFSYIGNTKYKNTIVISSQFSIFPPYCFLEYGLKFLNQKIINVQEDDGYYAVLRNKFNIGVIILKRKLKDLIIFHDEILPLKNIYTKRKFNTLKFYNSLING